MNILILIAGIFSLLAVIGHFTVGRTEYLKPILTSDAEIISKKVMHSLFHYLSVYMVFTTLVLFAVSLGYCRLFENGNDVVRLIGILYLGFATAQFIIAASSNVDKGIFKMFQWIFWLIIGLLSVIGSMN